MSLNFCSFSSGSSGNCYLVKTETTALLVDVGISGKKIMEGIQATATPYEAVRAVLVTHEHIDHVKSLSVVTKKFPEAEICASRGTWKHIDSKVHASSKRIFSAGDRFIIGDIEVKSFELSHDADEPLGYSFYHEGKQVSIVTDTGCITDRIHEEILGADCLVIEANHDIHTLQFCRYPYSVKRRILGERGHLSNDATALELCRLLDENSKFRQVILAHLSKENNFPEMAYQTVKNILEEKDYYVGKHLQVHILMKNETSAVYSL